MRTKTLQILAAITVPVVALAALLPAPHTTPQKIHGSGRLLPDLAKKLDDAATMRIAGGDSIVTLSRTPVPGKPDQGWGLKDHADYPVNTTTLKPVLDALMKIHGTEPKTADPALYSRLDLNDPAPGGQSHGITFADAQNKPVAAIILGRVKTDFKPGGQDRIYARVPGENRSWLASPSITLPADALDWVNRSVVDLDPAKIKQIVITQPDGSVLTLARAKPADPLSVQNIPAGDKLKADSTGADIPASFQALDLADVAHAADIKGDKGPTAAATLQDGVVVTLSFTKQKGQSWATISATGGHEADALAAHTKGWAYQIGEAKAVPLQTKLADLVQPDPAAKAKPAPTPTPTPAAPPKP